jgi:hypothetical protein
LENAKEENPEKVKENKFPSVRGSFLKESNSSVSLGIPENHENEAISSENLNDVSVVIQENEN